jgi:2'-5' RNA ligase
VVGEFDLVMLRTTLLSDARNQYGVGVQNEALYRMALEFKAKLCTAWRWSSKRSFVPHGVGVQSEALYRMALEFKAKLCTALTKLRFELRRGKFKASL